MSFSLSDLPRVREIKRKDGLTKRNVIAKCFAIIKSQDNITENVRQALEVYMTERLKRMSNTNLSSDLFQDNIKELLEYCCGKDYISITKDDVLKNEKSILQNIKWCIEYGNTKRLVWIENEHNSLSRGIDSKNMGKVNLFTDNEEELYNYFEIRRQLHG